MLQTKELKEVLKSAPEVTSLSATDRVQIVDANGVPKRIAPTYYKNYASNNLGVAINYNWVRVLEFLSGGSGILSVSSVWGASYPRNILLVYNVSSISLDRGSDIKVALLFGYSQFFPKARIVYPNNGGPVYLEVQSVSQNTTFNIDAFCAHSVKALCEYGSIPNGYTSKEIDLTTTSVFGGGVNCYSSTLYAILQKGGLRDDADKGTYQRPAEEQDGADCIGKRILYGFQHMLRCRKLHMLSRNDSQLSPGGATLWHAESGGVGRVQHADIHRKVRPYINHGPDVYRVRSFYKQLQTLGANIDITRLLALGKEVVAA